jgi:hypothetical protein
MCEETGGLGGESAMSLLEGGNTGKGVAFAVNDRYLGRREIAPPLETRKRSDDGTPLLLQPGLGR